MADDEVVELLEKVVESQKSVKQGQELVFEKLSNRLDFIDKLLYVVVACSLGLAVAIVLIGLGVF